MPVSLCNTYGVAAPSKTFGFLQVQMHLLMHRNVCGHLWVIHLLSSLAQEINEDTGLDFLVITVALTYHSGYEII